MGDEERTPRMLRRSFLKQSGLAGGAAITSGLAGCSGDGGSGGSGGSGDGGSGDGGSGDGGGSGGETTTSGETTTAGQRKALQAFTGVSNAYWKSFQTGFQEAAAALGFDSQTATNGGSVQKQVSQFSDGISAGVDAIVGNAYTDGAVPQLAEMCVEAGIPFVNLWSAGIWYPPTEAGPEFVQNHNPNDFQNGYAAAKVLFEAMGGSGGFAHVEGVRGTVPNRGRNNGIQAALEEYPDIERLNDPIEGNWVRQDSRQAMSDLIARFGDDIEGAFGQNDAEALGCITALEENDFDVPVVGIDGVPEAIQAIENDSMTATISALGPWQAGWSLVKCYDFINGWRPDPAETLMMTGGQMLAKNPDDFADVSPISIMGASEFNQIIFEADSYPYDWKKMSAVENPDSWDPQNSLVPVTPDLQRNVLGWTEENKPDGYELPEAFTGGDAQEQVAQTYEEHFQTNPLTE